jgi:hypothetical protein
MRKLLVVLLVLAAGFVLVDIGLKAFAQYWVGRELQQNLDLEERPDVSLGGFPFIPKLFSGSFDTVSVDAVGYAEGDVRIEQVSVDLHEVDIPRSQMLSGREGSIKASSGQGSASLTGEDLTAAMQAEGIPLTVRFVDGRAVVRQPELGLQGQAEVSLDGQSLVITPSDVPIDISASLALPAIAEGVRYTDIRIEGSLLVIEFEATDVEFDVPTG